MPLTTAQRIAKNVLALLSSEIIIRALTFVITLFIARRLGAAAFGKYSFALAFVALFSVLADLGIGTLTTRDVAREKNLVGKYAGNLFLAKIILGLVVLGLISFLIQFMGKTEEVKLLVYLAALWLLIDSMNLLTKALFNAFEVMEYVAVIKIFEKVIYFILCAVVLFSDFFHRKLLFLVLAYPISSALTFGLGLFILRKRITKFSFEVDWEFWKRVIKEGWPFAASGLLAGVYLYLDKVLLSVMKGDEVVGWYNAACKLFLTIYAVQSFYYQALFPVASRFYKESSEALRKLLNRSARLILTYTIPLAIGGIVLAPSIINFLYGTEYLNAVAVFRILMLNIVVKGINALYGGIVLLVSDKQKDFMNAVGLGALINLSLNLILIPPLSLIGAAIATVCSEAVVAIFSYFKAKEVVDITVRKFVLKPLLSSSLMVFLLIISLKIGIGNLFEKAILGACCFSIFIFLFKGITFGDIVFVLAPLKSKKTSTQIKQVRELG